MPAIPPIPGLSAIPFWTNREALETKEVPSSLVVLGGLDALGLPVDASAVSVDEHLRVADGVWAVGDVTGKGAFTHVAMYQARISQCTPRCRCAACRR
jgi:pyruvate/2-oxoglutarate dehydrogenase complex dihydrolipoamide dehydrogenase (E3) component